MNAPMANGDDQWPECDPEYIKALGRAVYNFAVLKRRLDHGAFQTGLLG
jgi:hypothetical protein